MHPSRWEHISFDDVMKEGVSANDRRAYIANTATLITSVKELNVNKDNYKKVGNVYLKLMQCSVQNRRVVCKVNNKAVLNVNQSHIFINRHRCDNVLLRVRALPFVLPIIERYGKRGKVSIVNGKKYYEVVGKADITQADGKKKRRAVVVILKDDNGGQSLEGKSPIVVNNKFIKSLPTGDLCRVPNASADKVNYPVVSNFEPATHNVIISPAVQKSRINKSFETCVL